MFLALAWIPRHCVVPDGFRKGRPFKPYLYQTEYLGNFYRVRGDALWVPDNPVLAPAFRYRHGLLVGPQKLGKDPGMAAQICLEGVGPALFAGWAGVDEGYVCREHGCGCGWEYPYRVGEPRGMRWPTPLIQVAAFSEKATDNTYRALVPMIEYGPLADLIPKTGEEFIRLPNDGRIDTVTSEARSRLGNPVTHVNAGELGIWDKPSGMDKVFDTMSRGVAGMGGRVSGTTNSWDPAQNSVAQQEYESPVEDIYRYYVDPGLGLSIRNKEERRVLLRKVYPPDVLRENGGHLDLDSVEPEALRLIAKGEWAQAARFFGNQRIAGSGRAFDIETWKKRAVPALAAPDGAVIVIGGDGSKSDDTTALTATDVATGMQWPLGIWDPVLCEGGRVPVSEVNDTIAQASRRWRVVRLWFDPPYWGDEIAEWTALYGDKVVKGWATYRNAEMGWACRRFSTAIADGSLTHGGPVELAAVMDQHIANAHKRMLLVRDDRGEQLWAIQKETRDSGLKIDGATSSVVSWEARLDAIAGGALDDGARDYSGQDLSIYDLSHVPPEPEAAT